MTKIINPGLMKTSRRNVLRGSVLAGAAAMVGAEAMARPRAPKINGINTTSAKLYRAADQQSSLERKPERTPGEIDADRRQRHLGKAEAEHLLRHAPQTLPGNLQANREHEQDDAKFSQFSRSLYFVNQAKRVWPQKNASDQISKNRTDPHAQANRRDNDHRAQIHYCIPKPAQS